MSELRSHSGLYKHNNDKYFEFKKLVGHQGALELELLAVVIALFAPYYMKP